MTKKTGARIKYRSELLGRLKVAEDFLPPPEELAFREEDMKTTDVEAENPSELHTEAKG